MYPPYEHALLTWLIIIGAIALTTIVAAAIDRIMTNRKLHSTQLVRVHSDKKN